MNEERTGKCLRQVEHTPSSFVRQMFHNGQPSRGGDCKTFEVHDDFNLTKKNPWLSTPLLAVTLYQGNPDRNHKLRNIVSTERYTPYAGEAEMLLHMNGKFTMGKLKSSLLS